MPEVIIDGTGSGYAAKVNSAGQLAVDATVNATAVSAETGPEEGPTTGSASLVGMNYNGSLYPLKSFNGSHLVIAGSISSIPPISTSNVSAGKEGAAHLGSPTLIAGDFNGSMVTLTVSSGSELLTAGSQRVINTVDVLGSVNVNNATAVGSLATQNIIGSINVDNAVDTGSARYIPAGSVIVTNKIAGSIVDLPNIVQGTNPWITFGSAHVTNTVTVAQDSSVRQISAGSVIVTNSISTSNDSVKELDTAHTGSGTLVGGNFGGSLYPLHIEGGSQLLITGSIRVENDVNVTQGTDPWIVLGSARVVQDSTTRQITAGSVRVTTGSIHVDNTTRQITAGSVIVTNTPSVVGSVAITNTPSVDIGNTGSVRITNSITTSSSSNGEIDAPSPVSGTLVGGDFGGSLYPLRILNGSELLITGSVSASVSTSEQSVAKDFAPLAGSTTSVGMDYNGSLYPLKSYNGSHLVIAGSISSMPAIATSNVSAGKEGAAHVGSPTLIAGDFNGSLVTLTTTAGSELIMTGSVRQLGTWDIGNLTTGSVRVVSQGDTTRQITAGSVRVTGIAAGSVEAYQASAGELNATVTQGTDPWIVLGSVNVNNSIATSNDSVGKEGAAHTGSPTLLSADFNGSRVTLLASAGSELITTGSVRQLGTWDIGNLTTGSVRVVSQGDTTRQITAGSVIVTAGSINTTIGAGSIQTYDPIGIGSVRIAQQGVTLDVVGSTHVTQSTNPWVVVGSQAITNTVDVLGSVNVNNAINVSAGSVRVTNTVRPTKTIFTGSITTTSSLGSIILSGTRIDSISIQGLNPGSTWQFKANDSQGYLYLTQLTHTGDWAFLSPIHFSGTMVLTISGAQANGNYLTRVVYEA